MCQIEFVVLRGIRGLRVSTDTVSDVNILGKRSAMASGTVWLGPG
jgi:hypothetical protein